MRLKELRKARHITQEKLAMDLNTNQNTISRYETGEREADYRTLILLADYFNVDMMYLLGHADMVVRLCGEGSDPEEAEILLEVTPKELELLKAYRLASYDTQLAACAVLNVKK